MRLLLILFIFVLSNSVAAQEAVWDYIPHDDNMKALVYVKTEKSFDTPFGRRTATGSGSGVVIEVGEDHPKRDFLVRAKVLTCFHVVSGNDKLTVAYKDGSSYFPFKIISSDKDTDLTVLEGYVSKKCIPLKLSTKIPKMGDRIRLGGYPLAADEKTPKYWQAFNGRSEKKFSWIFVEEDVQPGSSGGFAINDDNELLGIICGGSRSWFNKEGELKYTWPTRCSGVGSIRKLLEKIKKPGIITPPVAKKDIKGIDR